MWLLGDIEMDINVASIEIYFPINLFWTLVAEQNNISAEAKKIKTHLTDATFHILLSIHFSTKSKKIKMEEIVMKYNWTAIIQES